MSEPMTETTLHDGEPAPGIAGEPGTPGAPAAAAPRAKPRINRQRGVACACDEGARPAMRYGADDRA